MASAAPRLRGVALSGTVGKRADGTWYYQVDVGRQPARRCAAGCPRVVVWERDPQRPTSCSRCGGALTAPAIKRRRAFCGGFARKGDAQAALTAVLAAQQGGVTVDPSSITVAAYLTEVWLPSKRPRDGEARGSRGAVGITTWNDYRKIVERYLTPQLGPVKLQQLRPHHLTALLDHLDSAGSSTGGPLAPKTVMNIYGVVNKALDDAVRRELIPRNPADAVEAPQVAHEQRTAAWSMQQLRAFLAHVADDRLAAAWLLLATTGMRRGEVAGLGWSDLDLDAGSVRLEWQLGEVDSRATWKRQPKSKAGKRTMSLDPRVVVALREHRKRQAEERLAAGSAWVQCCADWRGESRDDVVFRWPDGSLIRPTQLTRWFYQHCRAAGLPLIRLHDIRHTYATAGLANARGWHEVKVISERLGHASVGITLDRYSHVLPAQDREVADTLSEHILGGLAEGS
jgi:integrase